MDIQAGKDFYIPNDQEVLDYARNLYLSQKPAYQNFREFLQHEIGMTYEDADDVASDIWDKIQFDMDFYRYYSISYRVIAHYGEATEKSEMEFSVDVGMSVCQVERNTGWLCRMFSV